MPWFNGALSFGILLLESWHGNRQNSYVLTGRASNKAWHAREVTVKISLPKGGDSPHYLKYEFFPS